MGRISKVVLWAFSLIAVDCLGQANQWIDFNNDYIRLKIGADGFYRVTVEELEEVGFPSSIVAASRIKLFRRGEEVAIRTIPNPDGLTLDYFDFWGLKNDGTSDTDLYLTNSQPHTEYGLFSDTASYFLTWDASTNGKRIQTSSIGDPQGLDPELFHLETERIIQTSRYNEGRRFGGGFTFTLSDYDAGEGWTGSDVSKNQSQEFDFVLEDFVPGLQDPTLKLVVIGRNSLNHVIDVTVGPDDVNLTSIGTADFTGYTFLEWTGEIPQGSIGGDGSLKIKLDVIGQQGAADNVSFALVEISYPQSTSISSSENKLFTSTPNPNSRSYFVIPAPNPELIEFFDVTNPTDPVLLPSTEIAGNAELVVDNTVNSRKFIGVSSVQSAPRIESVQFQEIDLTNKNYLIVTHPLLHEPLDGQDQILAYQEFRQSPQGGNFTVAVADVDQIYDQFNYGDPSSIAIKRLFEQAYGNVEYAIIIGKGRTPNQDFFRNQYSNQTFIDNPVMVPTFGLPGGDAMFSVGFDPQNPLVPAIPTGRLNAFTNSHVKAYLDKVKEMEALPYDELWRKNLIQLSGGQNAAELATFANYIQDFKDVVEGNFLGGRAFNKGKQTNAVFEEFPIAGEVNEGVGMITLFGHSSNTVTDIEIGRVSNDDPKFPYANKGKYPFILVNGCRAGDIFVNELSFGEDWMREPDVGCIGFIANADFALSSNLKLFSDIFYEKAFQDEGNIGRSIGYIITEVAIRYFELDGTSDVSKSQIHQTLYQGDPALKVFGGVNPDYELNENRIFTSSESGERILSNLESFELNIAVPNFGRTVTDSLLVSVERVLPNGATVDYRESFLSPKYEDTLTIKISNENLTSIVGENLFNISLDPDNEIEELNELNNQGSYTVFIAEGSTFNLIPRDKSFVQNDMVSFKWQPIDLRSASRSYSLEIDTVSSYNSPLLQNISITGEDILQFDLDLEGLSLPDSTIIYWRTRFSDPGVNEDTVWNENTFSVTNDSISGWGMLDFPQFAESTFTDLEIDPQNSTIDFKTNSVPIEVFTQGTEVFNYDDIEIFVNETNLILTTNPFDPFCLTNTINFVAIDRSTNQLLRPITFDGPDVNQPLVCGRLPQRIYNFTSNNVLVERRIEELIDNIEFGDKVIIFNLDSVNYSSWDSQIISALEQVGINSSDVMGLVDGQPLIIVGSKGMVPGEAIFLDEDGSVFPRTQQQLSLEDVVEGRTTSGIIKTPLIGPATQWSGLTYNFDVEEGEDDIDVRVVGVDENGNRQDLFQSARLESIDISSVDAGTYPYIEVEFQLSDETSLTPPGFKAVGVSYSPTPEGTIIYTEKDPLTVDEGQEIVSNFKFINVSEINYPDSLDVSYSLTNTGSGESTVLVQSISPPDPGDTATFTFQTNSLQKVGQNDLELSVTSGLQESVNSNNQINFRSYANVIEDNTNPLLDVTFDGSYILNGDLVSPNPLIQITIKDNNQYLQKTDTSGLEIALKGPGNDAVFQRISLFDQKIEIQPATETSDYEINYRPGPLDDGKYSLRVQGADVTGNLAGESPFEIEFEIVNESTITHFYPYPNPFSTSCRFVFTLTGSVIPSSLKIQIMTISGRVVREITSDEIGPIKIGNNITQFAWDGTDIYGDKLANGVYLYRVLFRDDQAFERRNTVADKAFKNGFGKIYILR